MPHDDPERPFRPGDLVWYQDEDGTWYEATVDSAGNSSCTLLVKNTGDVVKESTQYIVPANPDGESSVTDLSQLSHVYEPCLIHHLKSMCERGVSQCLAGHTLCYFPTSGSSSSNSNESLQLFLSRVLLNGRLRKQHQSIRVLGGGQGLRSSAARSIIHTLLDTSATVHFHRSMQHCLTVLQFFGNASTETVADSCRHCSKISLKVDDYGAAYAARVEVALLERNRVTRGFSSKERLFHILHLVATATNASERRQLHLPDSPEQFKLLQNHSSWKPCMEVGEREAKREEDPVRLESWQRLKEAFQGLGINSLAVLSVVVGILWLGNVQFEKVKGVAALQPDSTITSITDLLGCEVKKLTEVLTTRIEGKSRIVKLSVPDAEKKRDLLCTELYCALVQYLVSQMNAALDAANTPHTSTIDISHVFDWHEAKSPPGNLPVLLQNYVNEALQESFVKDTIRDLHDFYHINGVRMEHVSYSMTSIELMEAMTSEPPAAKFWGILPLMHDYTTMVGVTDSSLGTRLSTSFSSWDNFEFDGLNPEFFSIYHTYGKVDYTLNGMLAANMLPSTVDIKDLLGTCGNPAAQACGSILQYTTLSRSTSKSAGLTRRTLASKYLKEVKSFFRNSDNQANHYVLCMTANSTPTAQRASWTMIKSQLRKFNLRRVVQVAKAGYPQYLPYQQALDIFTPLLQDPKAVSDLQGLRPAQSVPRLLQLLGIEASQLFCGTTQVFFKTHEAWDRLAQVWLAQHGAPPAMHMASRQSDIVPDTVPSGITHSADSIARSTNSIAQSANSIAQSTSSVAHSTSSAAQGTNSITHSTHSIARSTNSVIQGANSIPQSTSSVAQGASSIPQSTNSIPQRTNSIAQSTDGVAQIPNGVAQSMDAVVQSTNSILPSIDSVVPSVDSRVPSVDSGVPSVASVAQSTASSIQTTDSMVQGTALLNRILMGQASFAASSTDSRIPMVFSNGSSAGGPSAEHASPLQGISEAVDPDLEREVSEAFEDLVSRRADRHLHGSLRSRLSSSSFASSTIKTELMSLEDSMTLPTSQTYVPMYQNLELGAPINSLPSAQSFQSVASSGEYLTARQGSYVSSGSSYGDLAASGKGTPQKGVNEDEVADRLATIATFSPMRDNNQPSLARLSPGNMPDAAVIAGMTSMGAVGTGVSTVADAATATATASGMATATATASGTAAGSVGAGIGAAVGAVAAAGVAAGAVTTAGAVALSRNSTSHTRTQSSDHTGVGGVVAGAVTTAGPIHLSRNSTSLESTHSTDHTGFGGVAAGVVTTAVPVHLSRISTAHTPTHPTEYVGTDGGAPAGPVNLGRNSTGHTRSKSTDHSAYGTPTGLHCVTTKAQSLGAERSASPRQYAPRLSGSDGAKNYRALESLKFPKGQDVSLTSSAWPMAPAQKLGSMPVSSDNTRRDDVRFISAPLFQPQHAPQEPSEHMPVVHAGEYISTFSSAQEVARDGQLLLAPTFTASTVSSLGSDPLNSVGSDAGRVAAVTEKPAVPVRSTVEVDAVQVAAVSPKAVLHAASAVGWDAVNTTAVSETPAAHLPQHVEVHAVHVPAVPQTPAVHVPAVPQTPAVHVPAVSQTPAVHVPTVPQTPAVHAPPPVVADTAHVPAALQKPAIQVQHSVDAVQKQMSGLNMTGPAGAHKHSESLGSVDSQTISTHLVHPALGRTSATPRTPRSPGVRVMTEFGEEYMSMSGHMELPPLPPASQELLASQEISLQQMQTSSSNTAQLQQHHSMPIPDTSSTPLPLETPFASYIQSAPSAPDPEGLRYRTMDDNGRQRKAPKQDMPRRSTSASSVDVPAQLSPPSFSWSTPVIATRAPEVSLPPPAASSVPDTPSSPWGRGDLAAQVLRDAQSSTPRTPRSPRTTPRNRQPRPAPPTPGFFTQSSFPEITPADSDPAPGVPAAPAALKPAYAPIYVGTPQDNTPLGVSLGMPAVADHSPDAVVIVPPPAAGRANSPPPATPAAAAPMQGGPAQTANPITHPPSQPQQFNDYRQQQAGGLPTPQQHMPPAPQPATHRTERSQSVHSPRPDHYGARPTTAVMEAPEPWPATEHTPHSPHAAHLGARPTNAIMEAPEPRPATEHAPHSPHAAHHGARPTNAIMEAPEPRPATEHAPHSPHAAHLGVRPTNAIMEAPDPVAGQQLPVAGAAAAGHLKPLPEMHKLGRRVHGGQHPSPLTFTTELHAELLQTVAVVDDDIKFLQQVRDGQIQNLRVKIDYKAEVEDLTAKFDRWRAHFSHNLETARRYIKQTKGVHGKEQMAIASQELKQVQQSFETWKSRTKVELLKLQGLEGQTGSTRFLPSGVKALLTR